MNNTNFADTKELSREKRKESYEVECIRELFPDLKHEDIVKAVEIAGPFRRDIVDFINRIHRSSN